MDSSLINSANARMRKAGVNSENINTQSIHTAVQTHLHHDGMQSHLYRRPSSLRMALWSRSAAHESFSSMNEMLCVDLHLESSAVVPYPTTGGPEHAVSGDYTMAQLIQPQYRLVMNTHCSNDPGGNSNTVYISIFTGSGTETQCLTAAVYLECYNLCIYFTTE